MTQRLGAALLAALVLMAPQAWAHQQKESITRVLFNPRTGNIEVMHRFLLHDVEHAVKELRGGDADILGSKDDREFFSAYVNQRFAITDQDGLVLPLSPVGHEIEGRFLWVYAETAIPEDITSLTLRHDALRDIWPEQLNLVNVELNGDVKSAAFMGGDREITIGLTGQ
jgi:hypothetical protein